MQKSKLIKFLSACSNLTPEGQITIADKKCISSHSDTSNVTMFYVECNGFEAPDGVYGVDYRSSNTFISSMKEENGTFDIKPKDGKIVIKFGRTTRSIPLINTSTLKPIRQRMSQKIPFKCKIEVDKEEFIDIIGVIEKGFSAQPNSVCRIEIGYNGSELYIKTVDDPVDCTERSFEVISVEAGKGDVFKSLYPFDFLKEFVKAFKKIDSDTLCIAFGNDMPLCCTMSDDDILVEYLLAQMAEQE